MEKIKNTLTAAELARWLITFKGIQDYPIRSFLEMKKYKSSKGWLFDIGAIYIKGNTYSKRCY